MKRLLAFLMITLLGVVGCGGVGQTPAAGSTVQVIDGGITITVRVSAVAYRPDQPVLVTVTARNSGTEPIPWIGNSGCDNGLYVRVTTPKGEGYFQPKRDGEPMACTAVMTEGKLEPGAQIEDQFTWDQTVDGVPAPSGDYTIVASFRRGVHFDQAKPAEVKAEVRLEG